jgi:hypothetical protein
MIALALVIGGASKAHAEGGDPVPTGIEFTPVSDNPEIWLDQTGLTGYEPADEFVGSTVELTFEGGSTKTYTFKKVAGNGYDFFDESNNSMPYSVSFVWWDTTENDTDSHDYPRQAGDVYDYKAALHIDWYNTTYSANTAKVTLKGYCYRTTIDGLSYNVCDERFPDIYKSEYYGKAYVSAVDKNKSGDISIPTNVKMADGKTYPISFIGNALFYQNKKIGKVTLPNTITHIYNHAFCDSSLSSIILPTGLKKIEYLAFGSCKQLTNITIPRTVTYIGTQAFYNAGLKEVTIPETVTTIKDYAFGNFKYEGNDKYTPVGEFTIYGKTGSEAEKYAKKYGFKFVDKEAEAAAVKAAKIKAAQAASVGKVKAKSLKKKKVQLTWKKANGVSGYEVYQSNKKNGKYKKAATLKASVTKWKSKKIKKGKKAFFKVRPYTNIGGKAYYGKFSAASAKVKK